MKRNLLMISLIFLIFTTVFTSLGCIDNSNEQQAAAPPTHERFTTTFDGAVGDGWIQVTHDNQLNVTIYRSADGYGYQGIAVIADKDL